MKRIALLIKFGFTLVSALLVFAVYAEPIAINANLEQYQFERTKNLVRFVRRAALLFHQQGNQSFTHFRDPKGPWLKQRRYIFIFNLKGESVFNAASPNLESYSLINFKDLDGKPVVKFILDIGTKKQNPEGWVHYLWAEKNQILPEWKSSFVMRVTSPSGEPYIIGSGLYNMRLERSFIKETVDRAAKLVEQRGRSAFNDVISQSGPFYYQGVSLFILNMQGDVILDPSFPTYKLNQTEWAHRNLFNFKDSLGNLTVQTMITKLKTSNFAWIMYFWPRPNEIKPSKKIVYVKKVMIDGKPYIIGTDMFVISPIWMRN